MSLLVTPLLGLLVGSLSQAHAKFMLVDVVFSLDKVKPKSIGKCLLLVFV